MAAIEVGLYRLRYQLWTATSGVSLPARSSDIRRNGERDGKCCRKMSKSGIIG